MLDDHARDEVARAVRAEPGRIRQASSVALLTFLSAAALGPVVAAAVGSGVVATALVGVAGNVGAGQLTDLVQGVAARLRQGRQGPPTADEARRAVETELAEALDRQDATSLELQAELRAHLDRVDAIRTAVDAAGRELGLRIEQRLSDLATQNAVVLDRLDGIERLQRRQGRSHRDHRAVTEEVADLARLTYRRLSTPPAPPVELGAVAPVVVTGDEATDSTGWQGGAEVTVGDAVYMLHEDSLAETTGPDGSHVRRQARAIRIVPVPRPGDGYVWLRQIDRLRPTSTPDAEHAVLRREHDLLSDLRSIQGAPQGASLSVTGNTTTLVVTWPTSKSTRGPSESLARLLGLTGTSIDDPVRRSRLFTGVAGLCRTLGELHRLGATHRHLTLDGILLLDDGRLVLRDLGLAARAPRRGESPTNYQAPEQRGRGESGPGPPTDVYQLAALTYHLITGHPPPGGQALPVQALAPDVPDSAAGSLDAALAVEPIQRPRLGALGAALRVPGGPIRSARGGQ